MRRTRAQEIEDKIEELQDELKEIRNACPHSSAEVECEACSDTGNYSPSEDRYWYRYYCRVCGASWSEDQ